MSGDAGGERDSMIIKSNNGVFFSGFSYVYMYYRSYGGIARRLRRLLRKMMFSFAMPLFYGGWKKHLKNVKLVILFDSSIENVNEIARYIKRANPRVRMVFWYWNPVKPNDKPALSDPNIDEVWSYNRFDAKKYNLKYSPQFYRKTEVLNSRESNSDLLFLGRDKGREASVYELEKAAEAQGLKCDFTIIKNEKDLISYEGYLKRVLGVKCIVDLVVSQTCGLTLRPLEALFYKKKLITNYEDIVNYDFYDRKNIFILGKDDINKLADFVNSPYKEIDKKIVDSYSYESWLKRIKKGEDVKP